MRKKTDFNIRQAILLFLFTMWCTSFTAVFADDVSWIHGESLPDFGIAPVNPTIEDVIQFTGNIKEIYDNSCLAEQAQGGVPTITIDDNPGFRKIEIKFESPAPANCPNDFNPVCGLEGSFGPLEAGEWNLWIWYREGIHGYISMQSFHVTPIYYVDADATGAGDGSSWANAFVYLQEAFGEAQSYGLPVEIHVAQGVYTPDSNSTYPDGTGDREATFQLISGVTTKGGYAGFGAPDPNVRDIETYKTILNGDLDGNDVGDLEDPSREENSYHVVNGSDTDNSAVIDGFTIIGGHADGSDATNCGGGIYINEGSPTIVN